jgi:hypothetical protein
MDIGSNDNYPGCALSNFAGHRFIIDGIQCNSMEGFLQSLKFKSPDMQKEVCLLIGKAAKFKGKKKKWWKTQILFWRGKEIKRSSDEYTNLIHRAYDCMTEQSDSFRMAIKAAGKDAVFTHSIGKDDGHKTVLTRKEFIRELNWAKEQLFKK